jgi:hypothetical protein
MAPAPRGPGPSRRQPSTGDHGGEHGTRQTPTTSRRTTRGPGGPAAMTAGCREHPDLACAGAAGFIRPAPSGTCRAPTDRMLPGAAAQTASRALSPGEQIKRSAILPVSREPGGDEVTPAINSNARPPRPDTPNVIESPYARAGGAAQAGGADSGGHASPQGPRQNCPTAGSCPYSTSQSAGMTGTAQNQTSCVRPAARKARRQPRQNRQGGVRSHCVPVTDCSLR